MRDTNTAVNTFETSPKNSVVAKPWIGPDPNWYRKAAAIPAAWAALPEPISLQRLRRSRRESGKQTVDGDGRVW